MRLYPPFRPGKIEEAPLLAELANYAGEGLPLYLWEKLKAPGQSGWDVGRERVAREEGSFSHRNVTVIEHEGFAAGCLIGYGIAKNPAPLAPDLPAMFVPLQELENLAPDTWYVNVLAVLPEFRNLGLGSKLLGFAEEMGRALGKYGMSLIVNDANIDGRRLHERIGYRETARRKIVKEGWRNAGRDWVLLVKAL